MIPPEDCAPKHFLNHSLSLGHQVSRTKEFPGPSSPGSGDSVSWEDGQRLTCGDRSPTMAATVGLTQLREAAPQA